MRSEPKPVSVTAYLKNVPEPTLSKLRELPRHHQSHGAEG